MAETARVTVRGGVKNGVPYAGCPLCGRPCEVRLSKTGLPYWQCPECRVQVFVRDKPGAERLKKIIKRGGLNDGQS